MSRTPLLYVDDILDALKAIDEYVQGYDYAAFERDRKTQDAVVRNLMIVGEAAGRLPEVFRNRVPEIELRKIVGLRNLLAHEYFGVSLPIVWDVVKNKLTLLEKACQRLREDDGV